MASSILQPEPTIKQQQLQHILDLRAEIARFKAELETAERAVRLALKAQIGIERGALKALLEDRWDARRGRVVTSLQIYGDLPV